MTRHFAAIALSAMLAFIAPLPGLADTLPTTQPGPDAAQVTGSPGLPNQDIFEVRFVELNGTNIQPRRTLWLEPGSYKIRVLILADHTRPPMRRVAPRQEDPDYNLIELELEAGKTYHIRGRYNRENPDPPYSVILHKVE
jgi:hypothetical protein